MNAPSRPPLVAGNWKMNGLHASISELAAVIAGAKGAAASLMLCPPATLLSAFSGAARGSAVVIGAQNCHQEQSGAFTGELSAEMLADAGATAVLVGHSERRTLFGETNALVRAKASAAWRAGLLAMVCVGETQEERQSGRTLDIIVSQLSGSVPDGADAANLVIAYEPVWAIGTGLTPTPADVAQVHSFIRAQLIERFGAAGSGMRILYGGSVKPSNAGELMSVMDVDGALVGGASLKAADFLGIAAAYA